MAADISDYRQLTNGPEPIKRLPLWPKVYTEAEL
jgi:hypothetical protein